MEELCTLSRNFNEPIKLRIDGRIVTGIVEDLDDDHVKLAGKWYPLAQVTI